MAKETLRVCKNGHKYYKSSDCPTCPVCESEQRPQDGFLALLSAPARRAFENSGILSLEKLSTYTEAEILALHGVGKTTIPKLKQAMASKKLSFRKK